MHALLIYAKALKNNFFSEIMAVRVVLGGGVKIMADRGWTWVVAAKL